MSRPLLLDLFCCAGGAGAGYHAAGFDVTEWLGRAFLAATDRATPARETVDSPAEGAEVAGVGRKFFGRAA